MAKKSSSMLKGVSYLLTSAFFYGLYGVFVRMVGLSIPIFYQNATRALVAILFLAIIVSVQRAWKSITPRDFWIMLVRAIAGSVAFLAYFYTILKIPFGTSYFLFYAGSVLFGFIFGHMWFSEHLTKVKAVSLTLAVIGLLLIYQVNAAIVSPLYFGLAILAGATTALWNTISKKISGSYTASYISLWDEALTAVWYVAASVMVGEHWAMPTPTLSWAASLGLGVLFAVDGILIVQGFKYVEAQIGSIIMLAEIIFAIFFGWLIYRETITFLTLIGGTCIITAIVLPEVYTRSRRVSPML